MKLKELKEFYKKQGFTTEVQQNSDGFKEWETLAVFHNGDLVNYHVFDNYIIEDWAGNRLFKDKSFGSFEEGWEFIRENIKDEDGTYDDYYVIPSIK